MREILNFPNRVEDVRDVVTDDGEVRHVDDVQDFSIDIQHNEYPDLYDEPPMPPVLEALVERVEEEIKQLKSYGAADKQIERKVGRIWFRELARLRADGIDVSAQPLFFQHYEDPTPEDDIASAEVIDLPKLQPSTVSGVHAAEYELARENKIEHLMDTTGMSRAEAERRA